MKKIILATVLISFALVPAIYSQEEDSAIDVERLCEALRTAEGQVRQDTIDTLITRGETALDTINDILLENDDEVQRKIAALIKQLGDSEWATRVSAHSKLAKTGKAAIKQVRAGISNPDREIAMRCTEILKILKKTEQHELRLRRNQYTALLHVVKKIPNPKLLIALHRLAVDDDTDVRRAAIDAIATLADEKSTEILFNALSDEDYRVKYLAMMGFGRMDSPKAIKLMEEVVANPNQNNHQRRIAALTIKNKDRREAIDTLLKAMEDDQYAVRSITFEVVKYLTGCTEDFGYDFVGIDERAKALRAEAVKKWKAWWTQHRAEVMARPSRAVKTAPAN